MSNSNTREGYASILSEEAIQDGFSLNAPDDHILELRKEGKVLARFSQTGVEVTNILKEVQAGKYSN